MKTELQSNAAGNYFWTRTPITRIFSVVEQRYVGSHASRYHVSTGKSIKASYSDLGSAVMEAVRRQEFIDASN